MHFLVFACIFNVHRIMFAAFLANTTHAKWAVLFCAFCVHFGMQFCFDFCAEGLQNAFLCLLRMHIVLHALPFLAYFTHTRHAQCAIVLACILPVYRMTFDHFGQPLRMQKACTMHAVCCACCVHFGMQFCFDFMACMLEHVAYLFGILYACVFCMHWWLQFWANFMHAQGMQNAILCLFCLHVACIFA